MTATQWSALPVLDIRRLDAGRGRAHGAAGRGAAHRLRSGVLLHHRPRRRAGADRPDAGPLAALFRAARSPISWRLRWSTRRTFAATTARSMEMTRGQRSLARAARHWRRARGPAAQPERASLGAIARPEPVARRPARAARDAAALPGRRERSGDPHDQAVCCCARPARGCVRADLHAEPHYLMKIIRYPGRDQTEGDEGVGAHKDGGFVTILPQETQEGLQVEHDGGWISAPPVPGTFVVNIGEVLELASNTRLPARQRPSRGYAARRHGSHVGGVFLWRAARCHCAAAGITARAGGARAASPATP